MDQKRLSTGGSCSIGDPYLAAHLYALGYPINHIDRLGFNRSTFHFDNVSVSDEDNYYNDKEIEVSPLSIFNSFKIIRSFSTHIDFLSDNRIGIRDIYLASYLHYQGHKLETEKMDFQYRFNFSDITEQMILDYYNGKKYAIGTQQLFGSFRAARNFTSRFQRDSPG